MTKTERIQFRVSEQEKEFIRTKCNQKNVTISDFIRTLLFYDNFKEAE